ncbi:hypothetical protein B6N60_00789 [Richelia sinica FACHB-800]|uniref:Uncharacterized protein n=1 Tax=Richelia sinica FACHB-800 TaxID=1357546 RepID=A0A975Y3G2_9NOST|nr:hypothetical protein B6N60_00789 [Richelia sinica FACHB-800]
MSTQPLSSSLVEACVISHPKQKSPNYYGDVVYIDNL